MSDQDSTKTKNNYPPQRLRALNPQVEKLESSTGNHVVLYFIHRLGDCLERRVLDNGL